MLGSLTKSARTVAAAAVFVCGIGASAGSMATTLGQPIIISDPMDIFLTNDFGPALMPTDTIELNAPNGTIGQTFGIGGLLGQALDFFVRVDLGSGAPNGIPNFNLDIAGVGAFPLDPNPTLVAGPGFLNMQFPVVFPTVSVPDPGAPGGFRDEWVSPFDAFGPVDPHGLVEIVVSILYDDPLPTRVFMPGTPYEATYVEGTLQGARVQISTVGGLPVPVPAALPLAIAAFVPLVALAVSRRPG